MKAVQILVTGQVQGVGFRVFAERRASRLGVVGFVRNLPGGHVELLAQGDAAAVESFCEGLGEGPRFAQVENVTVKDVPVDPDLRDFEIRY